jgi:glutathione synthase/RimK-type ligase-like ATP-grasp enzyme
LLGSVADEPLCRTYAMLIETCVPVVMLDVHRSGVRVVRAWEPGREAVVSNGDVQVDLASVDAAYLRPLPVPPPDAAAFEALTSVSAWADATDHVRIVNRPRASTLNNSKPLQLRWIAEFGFQTPGTLVTTSPDAVLEFQERVGSVVYKSTSGSRSIVHRLDADRVSDLPAIQNCPTQFQEYVPGLDVRVHVIGGEVFPLMIRANADDYRYAHSTQAEACRLPASIEQHVVDMTRAMGLLFAGVDFRLTPEGDWYCLEVNPSPGFTYFERLSGVPLAPALARLLTGPCSADFS